MAESVERFPDLTKPDDRQKARRDLVAAIGLDPDSLPRHVRAAVEALAGEVLSLRADRALNRARQLDEQPRSSAYPLLGVPVAVKDNLCTEGWTTTAGSRALHDYVPTYDADTVKRLTAAGAVVDAVGDAHARRGKVRG